MNDDTVKLVRIPADTWKAVVAALEESERSLTEMTGSHTVGYTGRAIEAKVSAWLALELARKVSAE